jgi:hypothetical protein
VTEAEEGWTGAGELESSTVRPLKVEPSTGFAPPVSAAGAAGASGWEVAAAAGAALPDGEVSAADWPDEADAAGLVTGSGDELTRLGDELAELGDELTWPGDELTELGDELAELSDEGGVAGVATATTVRDGLDDPDGSGDARAVASRLRVPRSRSVMKKFKRG